MSTHCFVSAVIYETSWLRIKPWRSTTDAPKIDGCMSSFVLLGGTKRLLFDLNIKSPQYALLYCPLRPVESNFKNQAFNTDVTF